VPGTFGDKKGRFKGDWLRWDVLRPIGACPLWGGPLSHYFSK